jgi:hypothetical protein
LLNKLKKKTRCWVFGAKKGGKVQKNAGKWLKNLRKQAFATICPKFEPALNSPFDFEFPLAGKLAIQA